MRSDRPTADLAAHFKTLWAYHERTGADYPTDVALLEIERAVAGRAAPDATVPDSVLRYVEEHDSHYERGDGECEMCAWLARASRGGDGQEPAPAPTIRSCNRHGDCDAADAKAKAEGRARPVHCRVEDCEDCYGK